MIADIINARVAEIITMIYTEIKRIILSRLPRGLSSSGGGAELPGLIDVMEQYFNTSVRMGLPENIRGLPIEFNRLQNAAVLEVLSMLPKTGQSIMRRRVLQVYSRK